MRYIKQDHDYNKKILFNAQGFPYFCVNDIWFVTNVLRSNPVFCITFRR